MSNLYGASKMDVTWPDEKTLKLAKMEYAKAIGKFSREQIHEAFEQVKRERQAGNERFDWPNVDAILGVLTKEGEITGSWGTGAHKIWRKDRRLESCTREERNERGMKAINEIRGLL